MARYYHTLAPQRFQVREGVRGGWFVVDTDPQTFSRFEGSRLLVKDTWTAIYKNRRGDYFKSYNGALHLAARLNAAQPAECAA